ncbi:MAG: VWA domain-containing protein [Anaerolineae bacterium]|nr:VWA domain-containing protein [Anaerolineae bacterium]
MKRYVKWLSVLAILSLVLTGCDALASLGGKTVKVSIVYGSEKKEWLEPLVAQFNAQKFKTEDGATIVVGATAMGSIESAEAIVAGTLQPTVWSPASSIYIPVANAEWQRGEHSGELVVGTPNDLVLSPVVIAMWQPMAQALGWPEKPIGWADIARLATSQEGWAAYGYDIWGHFKFGHTHPNYSNSGIVSVIAEAYAGAGKQRGLTLQDLQSETVKTFMSEVESSIIHYGVSTGFFAERMFERGPSYLSAAVMYENLVVAQETKRLSGDSQQLPVVAIYPKEGTFWSNHPYCILEAPWVTDEQKAAARTFETFLLDKPQQLTAIRYGFRPADPAIPLGAPLDANHGVDPAQPQTVLEVPTAEVISGIQDLWRETKKPVDLVVVMDISGSMKGDKINAARSSLLQFVNLLDDRDRLEIILFSNEILTLTPLSELGPKRPDVIMRVSGITEQGKTRMYDGIQQAYTDLETNGDPRHIQAIVVLSDGEDTGSEYSWGQLMDHIQVVSEGGDAVKIFTIAFGADANAGILRQIAEATGARLYEGDPKTINEVYSQIATFF